MASTTKKTWEANKNKNNDTTKSVDRAIFCNHKRKTCECELCIRVRECMSSLRVYRIYLFKWKTFEIKLLVQPSAFNTTIVLLCAFAADILRVCVCVCVLFHIVKSFTNKYVAIEAFNEMMRLFKFASISWKSVLMWMPWIIQLRIWFDLLRPQCYRCCYGDCCQLSLCIKKTTEKKANTK